MKSRRKYFVQLPLIYRVNDGLVAFYFLKGPKSMTVSLLQRNIKVYDSSRESMSFLKNLELWEDFNGVRLLLKCGTFEVS